LSRLWPRHFYSRVRNDCPAFGGRLADYHKMTGYPNHKLTQFPPSQSQKEARQGGYKAVTARTAARATDLAPLIAELQADSATSLHALATALNARKVLTASGRGEWQASQVRRVLARLTTCTRTPSK